MELKLPELGEGVHEGELLKWKVKPGDMVKDDQVLCEIMTDKATIELPSPITGKVTELNAKEGETVKVGQTMLTFEGKAGAKTDAAPPKEEKAAAPAPAKAPAPAATASAGNGNGNRAPAPIAASASRPTPSAGVASPTTAITVSGALSAAPATRKLAREKGIDLAQVTGSGPNGRIMMEDVEHFVGGGTSRAAGSPMLARGPSRGTPEMLEERIPFRGLRKKIAEKMTISKHTAAHFTYVEECDATNLVELRTHAKEIGLKAGIKVTFLPFIMKAMVAALKKYPILNSTLDEATQEIVFKHYYNISLSVQTEDGLMAPVIKHIESKTILEIAKDIQDVVERARTKKLTMDDLHGGTITLTNAGTIGGLFATPVINFPEVAILGFNKIFRKPVVKTVNGREEIVIRDWTLFSLSLDHRIVDGAIGAEFTKLFISYIENPALLLMETL